MMMIVALVPRPEPTPYGVRGGYPASVCVCVQTMLNGVLTHAATTIGALE